LQCNSLFQIFFGKCLRYPYEMTISPTGGLSCPSNCIVVNNTCRRDPNSLTKISTKLNSCLWGYSSNGVNIPPIIGSSSCWTPLLSFITPFISQPSEYISITTSTGLPHIIHQIGTKGDWQGWVSAYTIQYRS
jgi:hypothetical protein